MNKNTLIIGVILVGVLVLGVIFPRGDSVVQRIVEKVGSVASPDIPSPYLRWGDLEIRQQRMALNTATTTPCSIQSPSSTSTLTWTGFQVTTGSSTATTIHLATSTTAFATTTLLTNAIALASGAEMSFHYNGTSTVMALVGAAQANALMKTDIMPPNSWVVWGVQGFVPNPNETTKFLGTCGAQFIVL